jgi:hypothetical protein
MAGKKPAKKKAKDLEINKTKSSEAVKGGARISKTELIKLQRGQLIKLQ